MAALSRTINAFGTPACRPGSIRLAITWFLNVTPGFRETLQLPCGEPAGPSPSGGHENHPGLAARELTFHFRRRRARSFWGTGGGLGALYFIRALRTDLFEEASAPSLVHPL